MKNKKLIRLKFGNAVLARDNHKCKFCDVTENLDAHHITDRGEMPNGGYVKENGITLCEKHHKRAEQFHMSNGKSWFTNMHPDDLYVLISSSKEEAIRKSEE